MPRKSISLDDLRKANPDLAFALYAFDPLGPVTLEIITPEKDVFSFKAMTAAAAIEQAFPPDKTAEPEPPVTKEPAGSIFD